MGSSACRGTALPLRSQGGSRQGLRAAAASHPEEMLMWLSSGAGVLCFVLGDTVLSGFLTDSLESHMQNCKAVRNSFWSKWELRAILTEGFPLMCHQLAMMLYIGSTPTLKMSKLRLGEVIGLLGTRKWQR